MKALSIRQPWAWLIVNGFKDIENRTWPTKFRGRVLVHASKGMTRDEYDDVADFLEPSIPLPRFEDLERVYLVGGGTHPGSGLPVIFEGARITARLLAEDLRLEPRWDAASDMAQPRMAPTIAEELA